MTQEKEIMDSGLDFDSVIASDGKKPVILDGDYDFTVADVGRGRFAGSAKIGPCNKATLSLLVETPAGTATVRKDLLLHSVVEWKLSEFFRSIGLKKAGEEFKMDWSKVPGSIGRAHFVQHSYVDKNGNERTVNAVDYFIDPDAGLKPMAEEEEAETVSFDEEGLEQ